MANPLKRGVHQQLFYANERSIDSNECWPARCATRWRRAEAGVWSGDTEITKTNQRAAGAGDRVPKLAPPPTVTADDVARRAHDLYLSRGEAHGQDVDDWLRAEQELRTAARSAA